MGPALLGGSCEGGKGFNILGSPFLGTDCGWQSEEASEPRRRAQQQGCRGQSREIPEQRISADQHSPAREGCLLTHQDRWGSELRFVLWSDPRERTVVGCINTA